ncbi:hypothetical protein HK101_002785 [Irineochytrium annulatum]|nr:hypothetical protein HK101_002785 [Irineochytrium annulatum]
MAFTHKNHAVKFFVSQLQQCSVLPSDLWHFANFTFTRIWVQGCVVSIGSHGSSVYIDDSTGIIRLDASHRFTGLLAGRLGSEVGAIGEVGWDGEDECFTIKVDSVVDKFAVEDDLIWCWEVMDVHRRGGFNFSRV